MNDTLYVAFPVHCILGIAEGLMVPTRWTHTEKAKSSPRYRESGKSVQKVYNPYELF